MSKRREPLSLPDEVPRETSPVSEGTYGVVAVGFCKKGQVWAVKRFKAEPGKPPGHTEDAVREIAVLEDLRHSPHPNIVQGKSLPDGPGLSIVMEMARENLYDYLCRNRGHAVREGAARVLKPDVLRRFSQHLTAGLAHLHDRGIWHRDVKSQNVLVSEDGRLMLSDFGLSRWPPAPQQAGTPEVVTLPYRAPELLLGRAHYDGFKLDVWSLGCVLCECCASVDAPHNGCAFWDTSEIGVLYQIFRRLGTPTGTFWTRLPHYNPDFPLWKHQDSAALDLPEDPSRFSDLVYRTLTLNPHARPTAEVLAKETSSW